MAATLKASIEGLDIVNHARCVKGWAKTSQEWADLATTSRATLRRFWAGVPIRSDSFKEICKAVGIDEWKRIADFTLVKRPKAQISKQSPKQLSKRLTFAIAGSIEEIDKRKLDAIVALLNKIGGDMSIEILDVEEGSLKLTLGGSPQALSRIEELFFSGQLQSVLDIPVEYVEYSVLDNVGTDSIDIRSTSGLEELVGERLTRSHTLSSMFRIEKWFFPLFFFGVGLAVGLLIGML